MPTIAIDELLTIVVAVCSSLSGRGFSRQGDLTTHLRAHEKNKAGTSSSSTKKASSSSQKRTSGDDDDNGDDRRQGSKQAKLQETPTPAPRRSACTVKKKRDEDDFNSDDIDSNANSENDEDSSRAKVTARSLFDRVLEHPEEMIVRGVFQRHCQSQALQRHRQRR